MQNELLKRARAAENLTLDLLVGPEGQNHFLKGHFGSLLRPPWRRLGSILVSFWWFCCMHVLHSIYNGLATFGTPLATSSFLRGIFRFIFEVLWTVFFCIIFLLCLLLLQT